VNSTGYKVTLGVMAFVGMAGFYALDKALDHGKENAVVLTPGAEAVLKAESQTHENTAAEVAQVQEIAEKFVVTSNAVKDYEFAKQELKSALNTRISPALAEWAQESNLTRQYLDYCAAWRTVVETYRMERDSANYQAWTQAKTPIGSYASGYCK
jgi:hypothetical protein